MRRVGWWLGWMLCLLGWVGMGGRVAPPPRAAAAAPLTPVTGHPRLWLTAADLPRLRAWATATNPLYADGLAPLATRAKEDMDAGRVPGEDCGQRAYTEYPTEAYAQLFAFLSLIDPDAAARADYAARARTLLMHVMDAAAQGPATERSAFCPGDPETAVYPPFRDPIFFTEDSDRPRWYGEAFALTVDWIYPTLTPADKATIRTVFTRWGQEIITQGYHHPEPVGLLRDPTLTADRLQVRWAGNNYFAAHMRNLGLLALALDPADSSPTLLGYLDNATGAWLYLFDEAIRTDARGGLLPEGFEYSPQTASYAIQLLLALHTAGQDDPTRFGPAVVLADSPFWDDFVTAYLHSLSPATVINPEDGLRVYQAAWYGDAQRYVLPDFIDAFGALGRYDEATGNTARLAALRWIQTHTAPGGADALPDRVRRADYFRAAILYFMLFDPAAPPAADPRPARPRTFVAPGIQRLFSRTDWSPQAAWLVYALGWNQIDHQHADGNHFEFYRGGEWLTKARIGYANIAEGIASSEFRNTLAIQNERPDRAEDDWRIDLWRRGSQWNLVPSGDPGPLRTYLGDGFTYAGGDATNLYNSTNEGATEVGHASRDLVWLQPDWVVVMDRADAPAARFKRVWWQLPTAPTVDGLTATMLSPGGQQLVITTLLPVDASMTLVDPADDGVGETVATQEPMTQRVRVDAPPGATARFLHLVQGVDAGAPPAAATLITGTAGFVGLAVAQTAVLFSENWDAPFTGLRYTAPAATTRHILTGLPPNAAVTVTAVTTPAGVTVTVEPGGAVRVAAAGVLVWPAAPPRRSYLPLAPVP